MKSKIKQLNAIHIIFIIMFIIIVIACIAMGINTISQFNASAISAYNNAKNQTADEISGNLYQKGFNQAEESYHVSNRATLSIGDIKEVSQLEVLNVSDIEFVATDPNENDADITAILEVPGMGVYTVNIEEAEFIIDSERAYILVRLPQPELSEFKVNYAGVNKLFFKNGGFNKSIKVGEDMAKKLIDDGGTKVKAELRSNKRYYNSAKSSAENIVKNLVKSFNPDVENLQVDVEFYE